MIHGEYIRAYKNKNNPSPRNIIVLFLIFFLYLYEKWAYYAGKLLL